MKFIVLAAVAAFTATPALAADNSAFTGVRTELTAGFNDITNRPDTNDVVYGAQIGVDVPLGTNFTIGVEANADNVFEDERAIGAAARLGYAITPSVLGYGKVGYSNYQDVFSRELDGLTVGGGLEWRIGSRTYVKSEYRYSDFDRNVGSHAGLVGVGVRF